MARNRIFGNYCEPYTTKTSVWGSEDPYQECPHLLVQRQPHRSQRLSEGAETQLALLALIGTVTELRQRLEKLESLPESLVVPINTFAPHPFEIIRPIMVVVEPVVDDDGEPCEYIATFPDGAVSVTGDTVEDALFLLKDRMVSQYNRLSRRPADQLGRIPQQQLNALQSVMQRTE